MSRLPADKIRRLVSGIHIPFESEVPRKVQELALSAYVEAHAQAKRDKAQLDWTEEQVREETVSILQLQRILSCGNWFVPIDKSGSYGLHEGTLAAFTSEEALLKNGSLLEGDFEPHNVGACHVWDTVVAQQEVKTLKLSSGTEEALFQGESLMQLTRFAAGLRQERMVLMEDIDAALIDENLLVYTESSPESASTSLYTQQCLSPGITKPSVVFSPVSPDIMTYVVNDYHKMCYPNTVSVASVSLRDAIGRVDRTMTSLTEEGDGICIPCGWHVSSEGDVDEEGELKLDMTLRLRYLSLAKVHEMIDNPGVGQKK